MAAEAAITAVRARMSEEKCIAIERPVSEDASLRVASYAPG